jgi:hypothetical protein
VERKEKGESVRTMGGQKEECVRGGNGDDGL